MSQNWQSETGERTEIRKKMPSSWNARDGKGNLFKSKKDNHLQFSGRQLPKEKVLS